MTTAFALALYAAVLVAANMIIGAFGPMATGIVAFFLIGFDLTLRDWLQLRLRTWQMFLLIGGSGCITYLLDRAAGDIAVASAASFALAGMADWFVFSRLRGSWLRRANLSNIAGSAVDSLVFPTLAFGSLMPLVVLMQFGAKLAGGALWSMVFNKVVHPPDRT
jgi:uncharacterized PurR-regulated membrane protein YhhQ (DUF165 family)